MVADLRKMQENQGVSENRIDNYGFIGMHLKKARQSFPCANRAFSTSPPP